MAFFSFLHCKISKFWSKKDTHLIFFSSESWDVIFLNPNILGPYLGPPYRYLGMKNHVAAEKIHKKSIFLQSYSKLAPNRAPNMYQERWPIIVPLQKNIWGPYLGPSKSEILEKLEFLHFWWHYPQFGVLQRPQIGPQMHENFIFEKFMQFWTSEQHSIFPGHAEPRCWVAKGEILLYSGLWQRIIK